jgi:hypothetical protein
VAEKILENELLAQVNPAYVSDRAFTVLARAKAPGRRPALRL